jgi:hypothetical protein
MTLNYEWIEKSEYEANILKPNSEIEKQDYKLAYIDGAKAYKQAVEKAVNERIGHLEEFIRTVKDMHLNGLITAAKTELLILLDTLQTLTPTSND